MIDVEFIAWAFWALSVGVIALNPYFVFGAKPPEKLPPVMNTIKRDENGVTLTGSSFTGDQIRALLDEFDKVIENQDRPHVKDKWNFMGLEKNEK